MTPQGPPQRTWWAERATILRRYDEMESRLTASVSERMLDLACLRPGMRVLVEELPPEAQRAWEEDVARECEHHRTGGKVLLGGVTWLVVARR